MNIGTPSVWKVLQADNETVEEESSLSPNVATTGGNLEEVTLEPMTPEVAYMGRIAYGIVAPIIVTFGIFTNILNLVVLTRPTLRGPTYRYLMWLAVANLLVCVTLLPFILHSHHTPVGYFAALYLAHLEMPFGNALIASSVYIVVGLSIDRYVAVCHPRKYRNLHSHRVASIRIAFSFVIGFLIYIPMSFGKKVIRAEGLGDLFLPKENFQVTSTQWWFVYKYFLEICARFGPAILLALLNTWIIVEFKKVSQRRRLLALNVSELSGFPSQSQADVSQGTAPPQGRDTYDEMYQIREQKNDEAATETKISPESQLTPVIQEIEANSLIKTSISSHPTIYKNGNPKLNSGNLRTTSFCNLKKVSSGESLSKTQRNHFTFDTIQSNGDTTTKEEYQLKQSQVDVQVTKASDSPNGLWETKQKNGAINPEESMKPGYEIAHISTKAASSSGRGSRKPMSARRLDMERRLILLLVAIIIAFFITNIPTAILSLTFTENKRSSLSFQIFRAIANNLEFLNFGLNFVLYFLFSQDIRKTFMSILRRTIRRVSKGIFSSGTGSKLPSVI